MAAICNDWESVLKEEYAKPYYRELYKKVVNAYASQQVFPPSEDIFNAFHLTPLSKVKAVILGQDPYHNDNQAHGLCFSVRKGVEIPPSLENIYKEIHDETGCSIPNHGCLEKWAREGVLLLNAVLTVRAHSPNSHKDFGWQRFTDAALLALNETDRPIVYMLWGGPARAKKILLNNPRQLVLEAPHPSPLSAYRGFFGCGHFAACNKFLEANGIEPIDWQIE